MSGPFWCANCLNMSTRPRITFDQRGWCNACQWMERKKALDWSEREAELKNFLIGIVQPRVALIVWFLLVVARMAAMWLIS